MCLLPDRHVYGLTATIFTIIAVSHLFRIMKGWDANIDGLVVPMWISWLTILVGGYLACHFWHLFAGRRGKAKK